MPQQQARDAARSALPRDGRREPSADVPAGASLPALETLPRKHRAVAASLRGVPADQQEDALLQAVLVGMRVINAGGLGANEVNDADRTQWVHPTDIPGASGEGHEAVAEEEVEEEEDEALTVDELSAPEPEQRPNPVLYPEWWGHEEHSPGRQPIREPLRPANLNGMRGAAPGNVRTHTQTKTTGPKTLRQGPMQSSQTRTTTTTVTTVVVEPGPARQPAAGRTASAKRASANGTPTTAEASNGPKAKTPVPAAASWEIPLRTRGPTPNAAPQQRPTRNQSTTPQPRARPASAQRQPASVGASPADSAAFSSPEANSADNSPRSALMPLVRSFLSDPIIECLDLSVLEVRDEEDEEPESGRTWNDARGGMLAEQ
ncbi:hypothetical protein DFJ74DRAFT_471981 [Hyaloraphidium curvatum]|nr:hypothetical protein DFJ74DRAFT_471981 [Hyaloraphidium curvatum]